MIDLSFLSKIQSSNPLIYKRKWWRWTGSNRWPPACKAGALPAELHPRNRRQVAGYSNDTRTFYNPSHIYMEPLQTSNSFRNILWPVSCHLSPELVGLGGFEPPTSRLSGVRSNQLSYRPPFNCCFGFYTSSLCKPRVLDVFIYVCGTRFPHFSSKIKTSS